MPDRAALAAGFLARAGWGTAGRTHLAGDASARRYERLTGGPRPALLMDAPPEAGEDVAAFARVAAHLRRLGLSAPEVLAADAPAGFLIVEDFGDAVFARVLEADPAREAELYAVAVDALVRLQAAPPLAGLPVFDPPAMAQAVDLAALWYAPEGTDPAPLVAAAGAALARLSPGAGVMMLRDYHAENLIWLPGRAGAARAGLLDFQQAMLGHPAYDLVSLLDDARRDVAPATAAAMIDRFAAATGAQPAAFRAAYAAQGAQRALRILGVFARLSRQQGKRRYLAFLPRVWAGLQRHLAHPGLAGLAAACAGLPPPDATTLDRLSRPCPMPQ